MFSSLQGCLTFPLGLAAVNCILRKMVLGHWANTHLIPSHHSSWPLYGCCSVFRAPGVWGENEKAHWPLFSSQTEYVGWGAVREELSWIIISASSSLLSVCVLVALSHHLLPPAPSLSFRSSPLAHTWYSIPAELLPFAEIRHGTGESCGWGRLL